MDRLTARCPVAWHAACSSTRKTERRRTVPHTVTCGIRLGVDALSNVHFLLNELALPPGCTREKPSIAKKPKVVPLNRVPRGFAGAKQPPQMNPLQTVAAPRNGH